MSKFLIVCALAWNSTFGMADELPASPIGEEPPGYVCENAYARRSRRLEASAVDSRRWAMGLTAAGAAGVVYGFAKKLSGDYTFMVPLFVTAASAVVTARYSVRAYEDEAHFDYDMSRAIFEARAGQPGPATARLTNTINAAIYHEGTREDIYLASRMEVNAAVRDQLKMRLEYERLSGEQLFGVMQALALNGELCTTENKALILKKVALALFKGLLSTPGVLLP